jgi:hypothetical protein
VTAPPIEMQFIDEVVAKLDVEVPFYSPPETQTEAQFEITVYQAVVLRDQVAGMQAAKLAKEAQTHESLLAALSRRGKTQISYRAEEVIVLANKTKATTASAVDISHGAKAPVFRTVMQRFAGAFKA